MTNELPLRQILEGDCLQTMKDFPDESIDLIFTSPPYDDRRSYSDINPVSYNVWLGKVFVECRRVLKHRGNFLLNIANKWSDWKTKTFTYEIPSLAEKHGFRFVDDIIWNKGSPYPNRPIPLMDVWEHVFWLNLRAKPIFYPDNIRRAYSPASLSRYKRPFKNRLNVDAEIKGEWNGDYKSLELNELGACPNNLVDIVRERHNLYRHPAPFPLAFAEHFVKGWSKPSDVVLDPFIGSGTTGVACEKLARQWIGIELNPEYCEIAHKRLAPYLNQRLDMVINTP